MHDAGREPGQEVAAGRNGEWSWRARFSRVALVVIALLLPAAVPDCERGHRPGRAPLDELPTIGRAERQRIPDFTSIRDVREKKRLFFEFMRPIIEAENSRLRARRERLLGLYEEHARGHALEPGDSAWVHSLAEEYEVPRFRMDSEDSWIALQRRVDIVPLPLAMVQAANESAWGTSRFAREGNALFGQWCFATSCGIVPARRDSGATHEVAKFRSVDQSVRSYIHNLNTHPAYRRMRELRFEQRQSGEVPRAHVIAEGLTRYSERGEEYLEELWMMMRVNWPLMGLDRPMPEALKTRLPSDADSTGGEPLARE